MKICDLLAATPETGDYAADCATGRHIARYAVEQVLPDAPCALGFVVKSISDKGRFGPIEVGFFGQIAALAVR